MSDQGIAEFYRWGGALSLLMSVTMVLAVEELVLDAAGSARILLPGSAGDSSGSGEVGFGDSSTGMSINQCFNLNPAARGFWLALDRS